MKMENHDIKETFSHLVSHLKATHKLAYVHCVEPRVAGIADREAGTDESIDFLYDIWCPEGSDSTMLLAGGFKPDIAAKEAAKKSRAVIVFGRYFIANVRHPFPSLNYHVW
jgi:2,4-dienoyl-CoA reductase-like NADH-dependent reductase (Old Yellow Enzyme family)